MAKFRSNYTPIRFSHLTSYASIGSIVRSAEDKLMVISDIRYWKNKNGRTIAQEIPFVERVCLALDINKNLCMPPEAKVNEKGEIEGDYIPAVLFPTWAICKKCGFLHNNPWRKSKKDYNEKIYCNNDGCNGILEQVTWCAVDEEGRLDNVPWHYIAHLNYHQKCEEDYDNIYLELKTNAKGKRVVHCSRCNSEEVFEYVKDFRINSSFYWNEIKGKNKEEVKSEILEVNNPGVFLPEKVTALVIPPESRISKSSVIGKILNNSTLRRKLDKRMPPLKRKSEIKKIARDYRCTTEEVEDALKKINNGFPSLSNINVTDLLYDEYNALLTPIENVADDEDFVTIHRTNEWKILGENYKSEAIRTVINALDNLIVVKRLREIQVFKGFYRISGEKKENLVPPDITKELDWLPAIELFGEGIFLSFPEDLISKWESIESIRQRTDELNVRFERADVNFYKDINIIPRFLFLHTFAHLLIRELEITAGYPAASLKERIYSSQSQKMAGILVYTAVPDIVGSLGGIVESGEPKQFIKILSSVFKHADWCSLDPICTEHEGQGPGWLNRAACHACALIPEPSCEYNNIFLDRVFIKGSEIHGIPKFTEFVKKEKDNG